MNATIFIAKYKMAIIIVATMLIIAMVIYYFGKKKGKKYNSVALPTDSMKDLSQAEEMTIERLAKAIYHDMKGLNFSHNMEVWDELMTTSERVFLGTYNYFNQKYAGKENLYKWLKSEYRGALLENPFGDTHWNTTRMAVLKRMEANKEIFKQI